MTMDERVARLETQVEVLDKKMDAVANSLNTISYDLARYRGAWGMLVMVGGSIVTAITVWMKLRQ